MDAPGVRAEQIEITVGYSDTQPASLLQPSCREQLLVIGREALSAGQGFDDFIMIVHLEIPSGAELQYVINIIGQYSRERKSLAVLKLDIYYIILKPPEISKDLRCSYH